MGYRDVDLEEWGRAPTCVFTILGSVNAKILPSVHALCLPAQGQDPSLCSLLSGVLFPGNFIFSLLQWGKDSNARITTGSLEPAWSAFPSSEFSAGHCVSLSGRPAPTALLKALTVLYC